MTTQQEIDAMSENIKKQLQELNQTSFKAGSVKANESKHRKVAASYELFIRTHEVVDLDMVSKKASAELMKRTNTLLAKNAEAPEGKHYDLSVGDYVDDPVCDPGYHWSNDE